MFEAQTELLGGNAAGAQEKVDAAKKDLMQFGELLQPFAPKIATEIGAGAAMLRPYDNGDNVAELSAARASIWALVLKGGYAATLKAIEQNQPDAAQQWLQVRAFRKSTKLNSARADATQALADWRAGKLSQSEATAVTKADLLDAYNALMREALSATEKAAAKQIKESAAENAALAQGYFGIVQSEFETQRGKEQTNALQNDFAQLIQSAISGDWKSLVTSSRRHSSLGWMDLTPCR